MKNIKNIIIFILGALPDLKILFNFGVLKKYDVIKACTLMLIVTFLEAVSVATFIPLLELLQSNGDLTESNSVWVKYFDGFYKYFGLELSILNLCISIIILVFLRQLFNYCNIVNLHTLKHRIGRDLAMSCLSGILKADSAYIRNFKTGAFINTIDHQSQISANIIRAFATLFGIFITLIAYFTIMLITSPAASLIAITIMGLIILSVERWVKKNLDLSKDLINFRESYTNFLGDRYMGPYAYYAALFSY